MSKRGSEFNGFSTLCFEVPKGVGELIALIAKKTDLSVEVLRLEYDRGGITREQLQLLALADLDMIRTVAMIIQASAAIRMLEKQYQEDILDLPAH